MKIRYQEKKNSILIEKIIVIEIELWEFINFKSNNVSYFYRNSWINKTI